MLGQFIQEKLTNIGKHTEFHGVLTYLIPIPLSSVPW